MSVREQTTEEKTRNALHQEQVGVRDLIRVCDVLYEQLLRVLVEQRVLRGFRDLGGVPKLYVATVMKKKKKVGETFGRRYVPLSLRCLGSARSRARARGRRRVRGRGRRLRRVLRRAAPSRGEAWLAKRPS